ncbi:MAG: hypothetical protein ACJA2N_001720 [Salibacteraceae bacterium]|jgi:hypothetical protein
MISKILKGVSIFLVWFLILELGSRIALHLKINLPIANPHKLLTEVIYPEVGYVKSNYKLGREHFNILLLGGSVINHRWSNLEKKLRENVQSYTNLQVNVYNLSMPGHNSLDNLIKYEILQDLEFDAVVYYESINETRANNIDSSYFKKDYSHISWYRNIYLLNKHPELKLTVIPFFIEYVIDRIRIKFNKERYILSALPKLKKFDRVSPLGSVKTLKTNLSEINRIAKNKGEPLLLCTYAFYVPENVNLTGSKKDKKFYSACSLSSPITNWGSVNNTLKSLKLHNKVIHSIALENPNVILYDFNKVLDINKGYFCDICHMTPLGNNVLSNGISEKIIELILNKIS